MEQRIPLRRITTALASCLTALLVACGSALPPIPLQSPVLTPTLPVPPTPFQTVQAGSTQTPIVLPTATLGGPAPQPTPGVAQPTAAVGQPQPQPVEPTVQLPPSVTPLPSPTIDLTAVFGPQVTPNTKATSFAVILTITALAASPTYPPTSTPRPRRRPIIIGAGASGQQNNLPATTEPRKSGIKVQTVSPQVSPGGPAALSILTAPETVCSLQVARTLADGRVEIEPIAGTARQSAGRDGGVAWIWSVDPDEPLGHMLLVIDCGAAGVQQLTLSVVQ